MMQHHKQQGRRKVSASIISCGRHQHSSRRHYHSHGPANQPSSAHSHQHQQFPTISSRLCAQADDQQKRDRTLSRERAKAPPHSSATSTSSTARSMVDPHRGEGKRVAAPPLTHDLGPGASHGERKRARAPSLTHDVPSASSTSSTARSTSLSAGAGSTGGPAAEIPLIDLTTCGDSFLCAIYQEEGQMVVQCSCCGYYAAYMDEECNNLPWLQN